MSMSAATEQIMFDEMMRVRKRGKYSPHESNYTRLFGTPERAARTAWRLLMYHITMKCDECPMRDDCDVSTDADCDAGEAALLEWMMGGDAE